VQRVLEELLKCIEMEPTSRSLFTAQSPLFSVFITGIVAPTPTQRRVIETYLGPTNTDSRGINRLIVLAFSVVEF
jgi:hypothetical protein